MTRQASDVMIYKGERTFLSPDLLSWGGNPQAPPLPRDHPRIVVGKHGIFSTACWRGYIATWEIKDGHLYLAELSDRYKYQLEGDEPLLADWFSGELTFTLGRKSATTEYEDILGIFGDIHKMEAKVTIKRGVVTKERIRDRTKPGSKWSKPL